MVAKGQDQNDLSLARYTVIPIGYQSVHLPLLPPPPPGPHHSPTRHLEGPPVVILYIYHQMAPNDHLQNPDCAQGPRGPGGPGPLQREQGVVAGGHLGSDWQTWQ